MSAPDFKFLFGTTLMLLTAHLSTAVADPKGSKQVPTRDQIDAKYLWDLSDLYKDEKAWKADSQQVETMLRDFRRFEGKINSADSLAKALKARDELGIKLERVGSYAARLHDQNLGDEHAQANYEIANDLMNKYGEQTAWFVPALLAIPTETVSGWFEQSPDLKVYSHWWDDTKRRKEHFRTAGEEELIALTGPMADGTSQTFSLFTNADLKFGTVKDDKGRDVELSNGRYMAAIYSPDRRYRKDAFLGLHSTYKKYGTTLASLLSTQVKRDIFYAKAKRYNTAREASLDGDAVPVAVYDNLVKVINSNVSLLHRYTALRKRILKLDELHPYDLYVPLVPENTDEVKYDDAVKTILEALSLLGTEYTQPMKKGFESRWIDVYETQNKRSGAYCAGTYSCHPYLLLNYTSDANSRSTVAHEMGHAMHSWFTAHNQPPIYGDYTTFCAEVASTVNEALLNDYLLKHAKSDTERLQLINSSLEHIRTTVFRQTLFAEFEQNIHEMAARGAPLTTDALYKDYRKLYERYYGPALFIDPELDAECLRIPHFYRNFYVYTYATSYCAATNIARRILANEPGAVEGHLKFLKSGSSRYSLDCLRLAGVDMATPKPFEETMKLFGEQLDEMEKLLERVGTK